MSIKCYRTILEKSNPAVVREFQINDERSVRDLVNTLALLHGWETDAENVRYARTDTGVQAGAQKRIRDLFTGNKQFPMVHLLYPFQKNRMELSSDCWNFRLEELGLAKCTGESPSDTTSEKQELPFREPILLHASGLHPVAMCQTLHDWNYYHYHLLLHGEFSEYRLGTKTLDEQTPDITKINNNLYFQIQLGREPFKLNLDRAESLANIFSNHTVSELKQMAADRRLVVNTAGRKAEFVERLAKAVNRPEFWNQVLEDMNARDYQTFIDCCTGKNTAPYLTNYTLEACRLIHHKDSTWMKDTLPRELMEYYAILVYSGQDTPLMRRKNLRQVLDVCRVLYGVFSRNQFRIMADLMYPDTYRQKDIQEQWKSDFAFEVINTDLIYCRYNMAKNEAIHIYRELEEQQIPYYLPSQAEALRIARDGLSFPQPVEDRIIQQLRNLIPYDSHYRNTPNVISGVIYSLYHLGWDRSEVERELRQNYGIYGSQKLYRALFDIVDQNRRQIHMVHFRGQTQAYVDMLLESRRNEVQKPRNTSGPAPETISRSQPKVYPNSPCPCGSGKKYKYCHGKK